MKLSHLIITLTLIAGNSTAAHALNSDAGTRGAAFLRISPSARASGSAGAFTAVTGESICMDYNPAGIATVRCPQFSGTYSNWFVGTRYGNASMAWPAGSKGAFGVSYTYLDYGSLTRVSGQDLYGVPIEDGSFSANDMNLTLAYARRLRFRGIPVLVGAAVKGVRLAIDTESSMGYGCDSGADIILGHTTIGAAIRNMGRTGVMENRNEQLPQELALGISHDVPLGIHSLMLALDGIKPIDHDLHYRLGMEYGYRKMLFVRLGYRANYDTDWMTAGGGFAYQNMRIDYAYAPFAVLGVTHRISFSLFFSDGFLHSLQKPKMRVVPEKPRKEIAPVLKTVPAPVPVVPAPKIVQLPVVAPTPVAPSPVTPRPALPVKEAVSAVRKLNITARDINFETDRSDLGADDMPALNSIVETLKRQPQFQVRIEGHTDNMGNAEHNLVLSQARADSVKRYLISKGVSRESLTALGFGGSRPVSDNVIAEGRRLNRRVQFIFITSEGREFN